MFLIKDPPVSTNLGQMTPSPPPGFSFFAREVGGVGGGRRGGGRANTEQSQGTRKCSPG